MPTTCFTPIKARVARVTRLDVCGNPVTGTGNQAVFDGFVQIGASPEYEEGEEFILKKANGALCVNEKDENELKRVGLDIEFCNIDPDVIVLLTGERLITTGATGTGVAFGEGLLTARFALEVWQPVTGDAACSPGGSAQYVYWAFANVGNTMIEDWTFENGTFTFSIAAETKRVGPNWGLGPGPTTFASTPKYLPAGGGFVAGEHFAFNLTSVPPPTATCGSQTL